MGNKKSSGYAKKRKLSGNLFQNMAKKLRISDQGETSKANTSASPLERFLLGFRPNIKSP
jgi:hypothetical protein